MPVATVTSATIATTFLVSSNRNDLLNKGKEEDSILTDFVDLVEDFKERTLLYSKKGDGDGTVALSEEESQKLQGLIDKGVDISKLGEKPDNIPATADAPSKKPGIQEQGDQAPKAVTESRDSKEIGSNVKEQSDVKSGGGLDSSNQSDNPYLGNVQGSDEKAGTKEGEVGGDIQQEGEGKLKGEPQTNEINEDNSNDLGEAGKEQSEEQDGDSLTEAKTTEPQNDGSESGSELKTLEHKDEKDNPKETGKDSNQHQQGSEGSENSNQDQRGSYKESERHQNHQQQDRGEGDLSGNSDVTRFDLAELQRWQNELGSAKDALSEILSKL